MAEYSYTEGQLTKAVETFEQLVRTTTYTYQAGVLTGFTTTKGGRMSALDPVILNEVKLTQKAIADLASSSSGAAIGAVGQIVRLPTDATMPSDGSAVYLRSGILTSGEAYPDYPSWLPRYGGIKWTQRALPASTTWQSVPYGNGVFVAVASGSPIAATSKAGLIGIETYTKNEYVRVK